MKLVLVCISVICCLNTVICCMTGVTAIYGGGNDQYGNTCPRSPCNPNACSTASCPEACVKMLTACLFLTLCVAAITSQGTIDPDVDAFQKHIAKTANEMWYSMDFNKNGEYDRSDLQTLLADYDSNGDNEVTRDEFEYGFDMSEPTLAILAKSLFAEYDENKDGFFDSKDLDGVYQRMDHINHDGRISKDEFTNYYTELLTILYVLQVQAEQGKLNPILG